MNSLRTNKMKIALVPELFRWNGGIHFLSYLAHGLLSVQSEFDIQLIILQRAASPSHFSSVGIGQGIKRAILRSLRAWADSSQRTDELTVEDYWSGELLRLLKEAPVQVVHYSGGSGALEDAALQTGIDAIVAVNGVLSRSCPVPWISYLYDCQHRACPENFTAAEIRSRDEDFKQRLSWAPLIFVNANAVKCDLERYFPECRLERLHVLPFTPHLDERLIRADSRRSADFYGIAKRYLIICNQFWVHKDHETAFRALPAIFKSFEGSLVCTGPTDDYRHPGHFDRMMSLLEELGVRDRVRILGKIDRESQLALLKGATMLIQPTKFEGGPGGGAGFDAVTVGVPVVASNIPVNREMIGEGVRYFRCGDHFDLAEKVSEILSELPSRPSESELVRRSRENMRKLGLSLIGAIRQVRGRYETATV